MKKTLSLQTCLTLTTEALSQHLAQTANASETDSAYLWRPKNHQGRPCIVCHIDTWHDDRAERGPLYYDGAQRVFFRPGGLGGDDRAGVWAAMQIWEAARKKPMILFCDGEEMGGIGAEDATFLFKQELSTAAYFIELDRRGKNDAVFYSGEPESWRQKILNFGFKEQDGSFSDISILGPKFKKCAANLSIGFLNEHTRHETLRVSWAEKTVQKVLRIIDSISGEHKLPRLKDDDLLWYGRKYRRQAYPAASLPWDDHQSRLFADEHLRQKDDVPAECYFCGKRFRTTERQLARCPDCGCTVEVD